MPNRSQTVLIADMPDANAKALSPDSICASNFSSTSLEGFLVLAYSYSKFPGSICLKVDERCIGGITAPVSLSGPCPE